MTTPIRVPAATSAAQVRKHIKAALLKQRAVTMVRGKRP